MTNTRSVGRDRASRLCYGLTRPVLLLSAVLPLTVSGIPAQTIRLGEELEQTVRARVDNGHNVGIVVGVVDEQGSRYYSYGETSYGNSTLPDENSVFEIGSITKVFTATLLADMVRRGEVRLDDRIEQYLPDGVIAPTRGGASITLLDLATHTSGLPRIPSNFQPADPSNPYADYTTQQMYEFLSGYSLQRDIGERYEYSNYGAGLLGNLLANAAGSSYPDLIEQRVVTVLGMDDTAIELSSDMRARLAYGHLDTTRVANWDILALAGAGALRSTAADMLTFLAANLGLVDTPIRLALNDTHAPRKQTNSPATQVGLGWHIRKGENGETVWHNGGTGGYRSFAGFVRGGSAGVVVLTNSNRSADDIGFHLLDPSAPLQPVQVKAIVERAVLERYVGLYELTPTIVFDVRLEDSQLKVQLTGQGRFPIYAQSETEFFYTIVDAQITFEVDETGKVTALVLHQGGLEQRARRR
ncbi:MAG: serine hydrolase [Gemmatimonadota bacterium]|nr:MAG: serine hydrolase [Gemmatimonadota bacterium]